MQDTGPAHADCTRNVPFERDDCDDRLDALTDRRAERFALLHPAPVMRPNGPCARAVKRATDRMLGDPSEEMFNGACSMWDSLS